MKRVLIIALLTSILLPCVIHAQEAGKKFFRVIPLGVKGGSDESNLSAYLVAPAGDNNFICLDAGTLHAGLQKAIAKNIFSGAPEAVLKKNITAYFISHPHLDHVAGLIINSPDDTTKNIYGLSFCLDVLKEKYFSWKSWANFGDEGEKPLLNKYHYKTMAPGEPVSIEKTKLTVTAFALSHGNPYQSTAFLVQSGDAYLLYLGDTGSDTVEHANNLLRLWQQVAPLIKEKKLKAIMIETSFSDEQPQKSLFGHLTPRLLMNEMKILSGLTGEGALSSLPVVITHEKPGGNREQQIKKQLLAENKLGLRLIFPVQAEMLSF